MQSTEISTPIAITKRLKYGLYLKAFFNLFAEDTSLILPIVKNEVAGITKTWVSDSIR